MKLARFTLATLLGVAFCGVAWAQSTTKAYDLDWVNRVVNAPGMPDGSVFATFPDGENVALYSGALVVKHSSAPAFPLEGGDLLELTRVYNSKKRVGESVMIGCEVGGAYDYYPALTNWAGFGWTLHFGRLYSKAVASGCSSSEGGGGGAGFADPGGARNPELAGSGFVPMRLQQDYPGMFILPAGPAPCTVSKLGYLYRDLVFEASDGTTIPVIQNVPVKPDGLAFVAPVPAHPMLRVRFLRASSAVACEPAPDGCDVSPDGRTGYEVTREDGAVLWMERIVDDQPAFHEAGLGSGYIANTERNGW